MTHPDLQWDWDVPEDDPRADAHRLVVAHVRDLPDPEPPEDGVDDWLDGLLCLIASPLRATDTEVGRAVLVSDLDRRRAVACAATLQSAAARGAGANQIVVWAIDQLAGPLRRTEGFSFTPRDAVDVIRALAEVGEPDGAAIAIEKVVDQVDDPRAPELLDVLDELVRSPTVGAWRYREHLCSWVWDLLEGPVRLVPGPSWVRRILAEHANAEGTRKAWISPLVDHAASVKRTPSARWRARAVALLAEGSEPYPDVFARWFREWTGDGELVLENVKALRGLIWMTAVAGSPPLDVLESVACGCHVAAGDQKSGNDALRLLADFGALDRLQRCRSEIPNPQVRAFIDRLMVA